MHPLPVEIKNLRVLVHPLFSVWFHYHLPHLDYHGQRHQLPIPPSKKKLDFLLRLWASELNHVRHDPHAGAIVVRWPMQEDLARLPPAHRRAILQAERSIDGFLRRVSERVGSRLITLERQVKRDHLLSELQKKNWKIMTPLDARAFGEFFEHCVSGQADLITNTLREHTPDNISAVIRFRRVAEMSLNSLYSKEFPRLARETTPLGSLHNSIRRRAKKLRRTVRRSTKRR